VILVVAYIIYTAYVFIERNPLFGFIFIIVLLGIRGGQHIGTEKEVSTDIARTCTILLGVHSVTLVAGTALCFYEMSNKTLTHGLFL